MLGDEVVGLAAGVLGAALFGVGAVAQADAVRRQPTAPRGLGDFVLRSVRDLRTMLVVGAYLAGFLLHAVAIWFLPLYLAQAAVAMSLPVTALASARVGERLAAAQWAAVAAVTGGLVLLALGSGAAGTVRLDAGFTLALWAGIAVLAVCSLLRERWGGATVGALAGLGYAGSAIAVRGVDSPVGLLEIVAALAVPAYGVVAFWLYSVAMNEAAVSSATAPLVVLQTAVPALVGVALLGDGVRPGWWPVVVVGLVLSMLGAVRLSRAEPSSEVAALG